MRKCFNLINFLLLLKYLSLAFFEQGDFSTCLDVLEFQVDQTLLRCRQLHFHLDIPDHHNDAYNLWEEV